MPKDLPTVNDLHHWLAMVAEALVEASAYDDRAEVRVVRGLRYGSFQELGHAFVRSVSKCRGSRVIGRKYWAS